MLILPVKKKWFDMEAEGTKTEVYREITPFWSAQIPHSDDGSPQRDMLYLRNGYGDGRTTLAVFGFWNIQERRPEWGAEPGKSYYTFHIETKYKIRIRGILA